MSHRHGTVLEKTDNDIAQAVRRSHCDRPDRQHECAGTITVSPAGYQLDCPLCGGDTARPAMAEKSRIAVKEIFRAAGIKFENLAADVQIQCVTEYDNAQRRVDMFGK